VLVTQHQRHHVGGGCCGLSWHFLAVLQDRWWSKRPNLPTYLLLHACVHLHASLAAAAAPRRHLSARCIHVVAALPCLHVSVLCVARVLWLQGSNGGQKYNVLIDVPFKAFSDDFRKCLWRIIFTHLHHACSTVSTFHTAPLAMLPDCIQRWLIKDESCRQLEATVTLITLSNAYVKAPTLVAAQQAGPHTHSSTTFAD